LSDGVFVCFGHESHKVFVSVFIIVEEGDGSFVVAGVLCVHFEEGSQVEENIAEQLFVVPGL